MQLKKIATIVLASIFMLSPVLAQAKTAHKPQTTKVVKQKTAKKSAKAQSKAKAGNETKKLYGVKGAKLQPTKVATKRYTYTEKGKSHSTLGKETSRQYSSTGVASYYAAKFHGRKTANGEVFNHNAYTAAHKTLAIGSYALVTNIKNGRKVIVRINDRGPFSKTRILDLSKAAASELGMIHSGVATVRVEALQVDKDGYISGKGTESLIKLAKREGLSLKIRGEGKDLAVKAEAPSRADNKGVYTLKVVKIKTEKEAKQLARAVKSKAEVQANGKSYDLIIHASSEQESRHEKQQLMRLTQYQIFSYSQK